MVRGKVPEGGMAALGVVIGQIIAYFQPRLC
jgi:hypothetical protein